MATDLSAIHKGMPVYGLDQQQIGTVIALMVAPPAGRDAAAATPDVRMPHRATQTPPCAGGLDVQRGYGMRKADATYTGAQGTADSTSGVAGGTSNYARTERTTRAVMKKAGALTGNLTGGRRGKRTAGTPPADGDTAQRPAPGYILVQDPGVLGVQAAGMRVPLSAVCEVVPGERVTLDCAAAEAHRRYGRPGLEIDESADVTPL